MEVLKVTQIRSFLHFLQDDVVTNMIEGCLEIRILTNFEAGNQFIDFVKGLEKRSIFLKMYKRSFYESKQNNLSAIYLKPKLAKTVATLKNGTHSRPTEPLAGESRLQYLSKMLQNIRPISSFQPVQRER